MSVPVLDATIAIKWFLPEEDFEKAGEIFKNFNKFLAPGLFFIEFDAVVTKKVRQTLIVADDAAKIYSEIRNVPIKSIPYTLISKMAFDLSTALPIAQNDACYLAVAIEYNEQVYTADKRFYRSTKGTPFSNYVRLL